jgi:GntR family transcriptional regulator
MLLKPIGHCIDGASPVEQERLRLWAREKVLRLERLRRGASNVRIFERCVLPVHRVPHIDIDRAQYLILTEIADQLGLRLGWAAERLSIVTVPPSVALILAADPKNDLLQIDRVVMTVDGTPIEWRLAHVMQLSS